MRRGRSGVRFAPGTEALEPRRLLSVSAAEGAGIAADGTKIEVDSGSYDEDRLLVRFLPGVGEGRDGIVPGLDVVELPAGIGVDRALRAFETHPGVLYAEPDFTVRAQLVPNDPLFDQLYGLDNTGQEGGTPDADIDAPETWDVTFNRPMARVVVAVIDSGVDYSHPDLSASMWVNPGEGATADGVDNDGNGLVDDIHGARFIGDHSSGDPMDDYGHGTHVAGIVGAVADNGVGVAGVAHNAEIMALKFLDASGNGSISDAIEAIGYAVAHGAMISNNSWGGGTSLALRDAIAAAGAAGHLFVAAAGNSGTNVDVRPSYPASYALDNIVSVAATDRDDQRAWFSNYGPFGVDLAAPGVDILSTLHGGRYTRIGGTSMATPYVTGVAALIAGIDPGLGAASIKGRILDSVDPVPQLQGLVASGGRLNAYRTVTGEEPGEVVPPPDETGPRVTGIAPSDTTVPLRSLTVAFGEAIAPSSFGVGDVSLIGPGGTVAIADVDPVPGGGGRLFELRFDPQGLPGTYAITVGPHIADLVGNAMDQDGDGIPGEPEDAFSGTFSVSDAIGSNGVYVAREAPYEAIDLDPDDPGVATLIRWGDDVAAEVVLGADTFTFFGGVYDRFFVSSNGLITFGGANRSPSNTGLTTSPVQPAIAPLWDDWNVVAGLRSAVSWRVEDRDRDGVADRGIVEWDGLRGFRFSPSTIRFQAILELNTGSTPGAFTFNYADLDSGDGRSAGGEASVGIKAGGSQGPFRLLISHDDPSNRFVAGQKAIRIAPAARTGPTSRGPAGLGRSAGAPPDGP